MQWKRQRTIDDLLAAQETVQAEIDSLESEIEKPLHLIQVTSARPDEGNKELVSLS